jgi:hypothetical protein
MVPQRGIDNLVLDTAGSVGEESVSEQKASKVGASRVRVRVRVRATGEEGGRGRGVP